jgi:hypothetical protein
LEEIRQMIINTGPKIITKQGIPVEKFLNTHAVVGIAKASLVP